jgi:hypothetical protein
MSRADQEQMWAEESIREATHLHELTELTNEALQQGWTEQLALLASDGLSLWRAVGRNPPHTKNKPTKKGTIEKTRLGRYIRHDQIRSPTPNG